MVTLWVIWTTRSKGIHDDIFQSPFQTHEFVTRYIKELDELNNLEAPRTTNSTASPASVNIWKFPPSGCANINVDGGVSRSESTGIVVAFCRDDQAAYLGGVGLSVY